ncbi:MAG: restriction endonuclease [Acidimicrobiales bacterium]|nr:restriction endonuclease [Acidimicrobiales bacterium]MYD33858.1 restriction endonuclease [Acidimicrobiales bacterium]MYI09849.1 restriction endonuclease [Acidimicrobiales bacterium]
MPKFYEQPILNSPYNAPASHWELDDERQPTGTVLEGRRPASFISPIPAPRKRGKKGAKADEAEQRTLVFDEQAESLADDRQQYDLSQLINTIRAEVAKWRAAPDERRWHVTAETARLLKHWRHFEFPGIRPFFCQVEAVETVIWLTEVAPNTAVGRRLRDQIAAASEQANSGVDRLALKMATGSGKTTVMAMLIAWQTVNAVRHPQSTRFTRGFLVVAPGIPIRDRLRVLQPNDPDSYYQSRQLVPADMVSELGKARIVITNYHAFIRRETMSLAKGSRALLQGHGPEIDTRETEVQMLQRVMPELMGTKGVMVLNDEAHHCYREKPGSADDSDEPYLTGDARKEAEDNSEAARVWMTGIEAVQRRLGLKRVIDLSATPFFLSGSGYAEGTLFGWVASDFSLMDAIECGIVKLPRVPVADNIPGTEMPTYRDLWKHIGPKMPRKGLKTVGMLDPDAALPVELQSALQALYGHYEQVFEQWAEQPDIEVPPCFIVVCNNTATSKVVYDYISGYTRESAGGPRVFHDGRLKLFRNFDSDGTPLARPRTLLIDSRQLESGDALDPNFRSAASDEIERFRREIIERGGTSQQAQDITDQDLLREVMNTVGKPGRLGGDTRCVVSVAMLTEGWDANTVTHVLGVRAFGTQLLCEQVVGRALRRQSYDLNEDGLFETEYADVFGVPFDFTAEPVVVKPKPPKPTVQVHAVSPERDSLEIRFPRVAGYRIELPDDRLKAKFTEDSTLRLTPELVGPTRTRNEGILGEGIDLDLADVGDTRRSTIVYYLTHYLLRTNWCDSDGQPRLHLFGQLKRITERWLDEHLVCEGGTSLRHLLYLILADQACDRITTAIVEAERTAGEPVTAVLDPFTPVGTTRDVSFTTSKERRWRTRADRSHVNWAVGDSDWELEFCGVAEANPGVLAYVKNQGMGFEVPYRTGGQNRLYVPDFILLLDDGCGSDDPLHLVAEVKGFRGEDAKDKSATMRTYWVPGVNRLGSHGRWQFVEFGNSWTFEEELETAVTQARREAQARRTGDRVLDSRDAVLTALRELKPRLQEEFGIGDLKLFGSFARDEAQLTSDIDLMIDYHSEPSGWGSFGEGPFLEDTLGRKVDVVLRKNLRDHVRPNAERDAIDV